MIEYKLCKSCGRPMRPTDTSKILKTARGYKPHQSTCWSCWDAQNDRNTKAPGGHVYIAEYFNMFTQRVVKGMYKVGMTERDNPQKRIAEIGDTLGPMKVRIVRTWDSEDPRGLENQLHQLLKSKNITGEWFEINKTELIELCESTKQRSQSTREDLVHTTL